MIRIVCLLIGYVCGLFQTSFIYGKMHGIDIRNYGSGNAGTTNALRVLGTKAGLIVFAGDVLKCILAVLLARLLFAAGHPDMKYLYMLYAGAGAILGHNFPFYLHFKGGKGDCGHSRPDSVLSSLFYPHGRGAFLRRLLDDPLCIPWIAAGLCRFHD